MRTHRLFAVLILASVASVGRGQDHESRFEFTEGFLKEWAHQPVRDVQATLDCAGPVHDAPSDCELHIGARLDDPSIGDFQGVVLRTPSICTDKQGNWRTTINKLDVTGRVHSTRFYVEPDNFMTFESGSPPWRTSYMGGIPLDTRHQSQLPDALYKGGKTTPVQR